MYLYPSIYPKYIPNIFQSEPRCEFICTKMIFRPLFDEIENPIWLPKQDGRLWVTFDQNMSSHVTNFPNFAQFIANLLEKFGF